MWHFLIACNIKNFLKSTWVCFPLFWQEVKNHFTICFYTPKMFLFFFRLQYIPYVLTYLFLMYCYLKTCFFFSFYHWDWHILKALEKWYIFTKCIESQKGWKCTKKGYYLTYARLSSLNHLYHFPKLAIAAMLMILINAIGEHEYIFSPSTILSFLLTIYLLLSGNVGQEFFSWLIKEEYCFAP